MEKVPVFILVTILFLPAFVLAHSVESEKEAVKKVIIDGYISGVFLKGDPKMVTKNWHKDCDMLDFQDGKMKKIPAALWVDHFEKKPGPYNENISYEFTDIQISGYAAIATVEIYNKDKSEHIYTDFICLYKFNDGWKIAAKTFYRYPQKKSLEKTNSDQEIKAVQKVIIDGYISGVFLKGDPKMVKKNWHEACDIVYFEPKSKTLIKAPAVKHFEDHFEKKPGPYNENITYEFTDIQISGYAAIATVEIYSKDKSKQIYTDYMCLYKFDDGWKIATKTFYAYPHE